MTITVANNGTTTAKFTAKVTTALTTKSGVVSIPVTVDGKSFTRTFSWTLSLDGIGITETAEYYAISNSSTTAPADSAFSTTVPTTTTAKPYLWNYEKTTYSNGVFKSTSKRVIGVHGQNGTDGAGISKVENYYLASASASGVTTSTSGWTTDAASANATISDTKPYLWNYEKITYTKGNPTTTSPHIIGKYGKDGNGIDRIEEEYYLSTSRTALQGGSWSTTRPTWKAGHYYWTRTHIYYDNGDSEVTNGICVTGEMGTSVLAQYSANGTSWHSTYTTGDQWMRTSDDNGATWSAAVKIAASNYSNNLLLNSAFEKTTYWVLGTGSSLDTTKKREGRNSIKIHHTGQTANSYAGLTQNYTSNSALTLGAGTVVTASVWTFTDDLSVWDAGASIEIDCYAADGTRLAVTSRSIKPTKVTNGKGSIIHVHFLQTHIILELLSTSQRMVVCGSTPQNTR